MCKTKALGAKCTDAAKGTGSSLEQSDLYDWYRALKGC